MPFISEEIGDAISLAFYNLSQHNEMLYDYWLSELYDENGDMILEAWNQSYLKLMENDVMNEVNL